MLLYNDIFNWQGFGGKLRLASGKCRLKIFDLSGDRKDGLVHLKPVVVIASDHPDSKMSVRSCSGHIVTRVSRRFQIAPGRLQFVEYYPARRYGKQADHIIPEAFEGVEFTWKDDLAIHPKLRPLAPLLLKRLGALMSGEHASG